MIDKSIQQELKNIWDSYETAGQRVVNKKGLEYDDLDGNRRTSIEDIKKIIAAFMQDKLALPEFKN